MCRRPCGHAACKPRSASCGPQAPAVHALQPASGIPECSRMAAAGHDAVLLAGATLPWRAQRSWLPATPTGRCSARPQRTPLQRQWRSGTRSQPPVFPVGSNTHRCSTSQKAAHPPGRQCRELTAGRSAVLVGSALAEAAHSTRQWCRCSTHTVALAGHETLQQRLISDSDESQWSHSLIAPSLLLAGAALAVALGVLLCLPGQALVDLEARGAAIPIVVADVTVTADALVALGVDRVLALCVAVIAAGQQSGCQ